MKVVIHPAAKDASGYYRLHWPAEALLAQGHENTEVRYDFSYTGEWIGHGKHKKLIRVLDDVEDQVIVLQRPLWKWQTELVEQLQAKGAAVVIEVDDNFSKLALKHPIYKDVHPLQGDPNKSYLWLQRCCELADLVTVTTPALAEQYAKHGRYAILPNYAPKRYLEIPRPEPRDTPWVGWTGQVASHVGDLQSTKGAVAEAIRATGAQAHVIGTGQGFCDALGAEKATASGFVAIEDYPAYYAQLDVAVVPLRRTVFNDSKSWLKFLESSSLGVPCVASPTQPNTLLHEMGVGLLASTPDEWQENVERLIRDVPYRLKMGSEAREIVREHLVLEDQAHKWIDAWSSAAKYRNDRLSSNDETKEVVA